LAGVVPHSHRDKAFDAWLLNTIWFSLSSSMLADSEVTLDFSIVAQSLVSPFHIVSQAHSVRVVVSQSLSRCCLGMKPSAVYFEQVVHAPIFGNNLESLCTSRRDLPQGYGEASPPRCLRASETTWNTDWAMTSQHPQLLKSTVTRSKNSFTFS
jgi:hypothetical protein